MSVLSNATEGAFLFHFTPNLQLVAFAMTKVEEVFSFYGKLLRNIGLWPDPPLTKLHTRIVWVIFLFWLLVPYSLIALSVSQAETIDELAVSLMYTSGFFWILFYFLLFYKNRLKILKLSRNWIKVLYENKDANSFVDDACIQVLKVTKFLLILALITTTISMTVAPLFFGVLPVTMWKPRWADQKLVLITYWFLQIFTFGFGLLVDTTLFFMFSLLVIINGYAKFLGSKIKVLGNSPSDDGYMDMVECVRIHQKVKEIIKEFLDIFGTPMGILYNSLMFIVGALVFGVTKGEGQLTFRENMMFYSYILASFIFLFIPSYFGQEIISTSENFMYHLFSSDWTNTDMKYKKALLIFMMNLKEPINLKIIQRDYLSLQGFQDTLNAGYSIYSVFTKLKKKKKSDSN